MHLAVHLCTKSEPTCGSSHRQMLLVLVLGRQREAGSLGVHVMLKSRLTIWFLGPSLSSVHTSIWIVTILTKQHDCPEGLCNRVLLKFTVPAAAHSGAKLTRAATTVTKCSLKQPDILNGPSALG